MSQWIVRDGVEFEVQLDDAGFQEKYEDAFEKMDEAENELKKVGRISEFTKGYCMMFERLFDDIFGAGSSEKIFEGKRNITLCNEVYDSFLEHCSKESERIRAAQQKTLRKYAPKKGKK